MSDIPTRLSAISKRGAPHQVTKADLDFVDAAIQLHRAGTAYVGESVGIDSSNPVACDPVDVAAAVVAVAVLAYHVYNSCLIGGDSEVMRMAQKLNVAPTVSLEGLIESRNQLAEAMGQERIR
jgi:hypothetical protein